MANHKSALKRHRQSVKRRQRNLAIKTHVRHLIRSVRQAAASQDGSTAGQLLAEASKALDKAATKGVYHRNAAARRIARLSRAVSRLTAASGS